MADEFNPEAIDGDGDGIVQENTEFERPVETDSSFVISDNDAKAILVEEPAVSAVEEKVDDAVISTASTNAKPKRERPALAPVNNGAIGSSSVDVAAEKPAKKTSSKKIEEGSVAVFAKRNVRWEGVGSLFRGYNIVSKDEAAKWLTLDAVREATPEEIKKLG